MRRLLVLPVLVAAAAVTAPAAGTSSASGLFGLVMRGPITPVCVAEKPCSKPAANVTLLFFRSGREVARTTTRRNGAYRVALRPGTYSVRLVRKPTIGRGLEPTAARVPQGRFSRVDFSIDTGIR